ncbi:MAG: GAF domain-containing protein [Chloroflexi bacterium]|nr:GAF domain-containing protein [Chloroflexota bacterium]
MTDRPIVGQSQLAILLENLPQAVVLYDFQRERLRLNAAGRRLLGVTGTAEDWWPIELIMGVRRLFTPDGKPVPTAGRPSQRLRRGETVLPQRFRIVVPESGSRLVVVEGQPIAGADGVVIGGLATIVDVTEEETRLETERIALDVARAVTEDTPPLAGLARALRRIADPMDAEICAIWLAEADRRRLSLLIHHNLPPEVADLIAECSFDAPNLVAQAAASGSAVILDDRTPLSARPAMSQYLSERLGVRTEVAVPLAAHGRLVGVLGGVCRTARRLSPWQLTTLAEVEHILAGAVESHGLSAELAAVRARADRMVADLDAVSRVALRPLRLIVAVDELISQMVKRIGANTGALWLLADDGATLVLQSTGWQALAADASIRYRLRLGEGLVGRVAAGGQPLVVLDVQADPRTHGSFLQTIANQNIHTTIMLPLRIGNRLIGVAGLAWQEVKPAAVADGLARRLQPMVDIAALAIERARLADQVEHERVRLDAVIESSPNGVFFLDALADRVITNRQARLLLCGTDDCTVTRSILADRIRAVDGTPFPAEQSPVVRALRGETIAGEETRICRPDGEFSPTLVNAAAIADEDGVIGFVVSLQDISALAELHQVREEFVSMVAHDLRAPITAIKGYTVLLARLPAERHGGPEEQRMLANVSSSVRQLERMASDLLDASRVETRQFALERHPLDLAASVRQVIEQLRESLGDRAAELGGNLNAIVMADPQRLHQALANLLVNAARYSSPGTPIRVDLHPGRPGFAEVAVTNFGVGIPEEQRTTLFERFVQGPRTRRAEGLGLGLYITRGIVEAHGGQIRCESDGTSYVTFRFTLPIAGEEPGG